LLYIREIVIITTIIKIYMIAIGEYTEIAAFSTDENDFPTILQPIYNEIS